MTQQSIAIQPLSSPPDAEVYVPGSKSYTNRALAVAALAEGTSTLREALFSDDTLYMSRALPKLGIRVKSREEESLFEVDGQGGQFPIREADLFVGNAGTAMRFLAALVSISPGAFRIDGNERMRQRPIQDLLFALRSLGVQARSINNDGCPPVEIRSEGIEGGRAVVPGTKSSQFLSALLLAVPYARKDVHLEVQGDLIAKPYIDITLSVMDTFGVQVTRNGYQSFSIAAGQRYQPRDYKVEPDASNASYFFAAAALLGGRVRVMGLNARSAQGDAKFVDILADMGCRVLKGEDFIEVEGPGKLRGIDVDMNALSDTMQTLAAIAPFAEGEVVIRNVGHTRLQETDRLHAVAAELQRLGIKVEEGEDSLRIQPGKVKPCAIDTYDDHRMAMSFALIGLKVPGIVINDPGCVSKTFPDYFERLEKLRTD